MGNVLHLEEITNKMAEIQEYCGVRMWWTGKVRSVGALGRTGGQRQGVLALVVRTREQQLLSQEFREHPLLKE